MAARFIALLALSSWAVASPVFQREVQDNTTTPATPVVTVSRTFTVPAWTKTDTLTQLLNCTRTNYVSAGAAPGPTSTASHSAAPILGRQTSSTPPTTTPPPPPPTTSSVRTITRTTWVVETSTHTGDLSVTDYLCSATVEYAYTVDATTTSTYTQTIWPKDHTVTATTTISCNRPTVPPATSRPVPPPTHSSSPPAPPASTKSSSPAGKKRGNGAAVHAAIVASSSSSSSSSAPLVTPTPVPPTTSTPPTPPTTGPLTPVTTLHITHTVYARTTITATGYTTAWVWTCSATSAGTTSTSSSAAPPAST